MGFFTPNPRFVFGGAPKFRELLNKISSTVAVDQKNAPVFAADNMITIAKITGFLEEDRFVEYANKHFKDDDLHSSIIWRIHILAWAMDSCKGLKGDFIEFGCYDAKVAEFLIDYNQLDKLNKSFYLYDIFDEPPTARGEKHSPDLYDDVINRLSKHKFVKVIKGLLPKSFENNIPDSISFVHLDLNSAETEIALLEKFYDKLVPGGIIILDDYATMGYEEQYFTEKKFFEKKKHSVVELPTGQGMVIKR